MNTAVSSGVHAGAICFQVPSDLRALAVICQTIALHERVRKSASSWIMTASTLDSSRGSSRQHGMAMDSTRLSSHGDLQMGRASTARIARSARSHLAPRLRQAGQRIKTLQSPRRSKARHLTACVYQTFGGRERRAICIVKG